MRARRAVGAAVVICLATACTWTADEPGLLGRDRPSPPTEQSAEHRPPVRLPMAGEAEWTSPGAPPVTVRLAVHTVRRTPNGTVLDWSVTPVPTDPGQTGSRVRPDLDLGLSAPGEGLPTVFLVDPDAGRVYRPLVRRSGETRCVCTPMEGVQQNLVYGETRLLQTAFPPLPAELPIVDVNLSTVPLFSTVPVLALGVAPGGNPVDLARPVRRPGSGDPVAWKAPDGQEFLLWVRRVVASPHFTSVEWWVDARTPGSRAETLARPPFADPGLPGPTGTPLAASGPRLVDLPTGQRVAALRVTGTGDGPSRAECLCTDLRPWATLARAGETSRSLVTTFGPLPGRPGPVRVAFPGAGEVTVEATPAQDARLLLVDRGAADPADFDETSDYHRLPPATGWSAEDWPTTLPHPDTVRRARAAVDRLSR